MVAKADENPHSRSNVSEIGLSADGQESCNEGGGNEHSDLFVILRNDRSWREGESWRWDGKSREIEQSADQKNVRVLHTVQIQIYLVCRWRTATRTRKVVYISINRGGKMNVLPGTAQILHVLVSMLLLLPPRRRVRATTALIAKVYLCRLISRGTDCTSFQRYPGALYLKRVCSSCPATRLSSRLTALRACRRRTDPKMPNAPMVRQLRPFWNTHGMRTRSRARKTTRFLPVLPGD